MPYRSLVLVLALACHAAPAAALFHLWDVSEVFTNAERSVQFIEFFTNSSDQNVLGNHFVETYIDNVMQAQFTIPSDLSATPSTAGRFFLIATPAFAAAAGIEPDYVLPAASFIGEGIDAVGLVGADSMSIAQPPLPTDGVSSLNEDFSQLGENLFVADATPTNFAGDIGTIVPEPGAGLAGVVAVACVASQRRRFASRAG
jgi:hypothetical protein